MNKPQITAPSQYENDQQAIDQIVSRAQEAIRDFCGDGYVEHAIAMLEELMATDRDFAGQLEIVQKYVEFKRESA